MNLVQTPWAPGTYYAQPTHKNLIVLHHTVAYDGMSVVNYLQGESRKAMSLPNPYTIGVPYVVNWDGAVYQCYDDQYWAFHSGLGGNAGIDVRSVGIEIDNLGGLRPVGNQLVDAYNQPFGRTRNNSLVYDNGVPWRGYRFYEQYYPIQIDTVIELCEMLIQKYNIPRLIPANFLPEVNYPIQKVMKMQGIATHIHFLPAQYKQDLSIAFTPFLQHFKEALHLQEYDVMAL